MKKDMADAKKSMPLEVRRRKLLAEGALYRIGIVAAREHVQSNLNAPSLAKSAMRRMGGAVSASIGGLFTGKAGATLQSLSPLLISGASLLSKRYLRKPLLYCSIVGAGVALAYYFSRKNDERGDNEDTPASDGE